MPQTLNVSFDQSLKWILQPDGGYIYNGSNGQVFALNRTASYIVRQLMDGLSVQRVIDDLVAQTKVDPRTCEADLRELLASLERLGYVCLSLN